MRLYILTLFFINLLFAQAVNWDNRLHKVSIFPPDDGIPEQSVPSNKTLKDIIRLGQQDVMVEEGRVELVVMSYRAIDAEIEEYQRQTQSGAWVRACMIFALLFINIWGL